MSSLGRFLVYGNFWVSLCASALTWLTCVELDLEIDFVLILFVFFSTLVIYNMNMISGLVSLSQKGTESERHLWCLANAKVMKLTALLGILGSSYCFAFLNIETWLVLAPFALAAVMYVVPLIGKRGNGVRLREFGLNKIFTIAIVWAVVTVVLPVVNTGNMSSFTDPKVIMVAVARAVFIFAITLPFDIRDITNDRKIDVKTIPMLLGVKRTIGLSVFVLLLYGLNYLFFSTDPMIGAGHLLGALITMVLVLLTNARRGDMFYSFTLEGTMILLVISVYGLSLIH